ncbi:efflux RND transporter periplasmic adaptor subunit [Temperatibacter marinus]|uniref:Efflux RND transporter periplasmic adaptor subunit n=1 Tax=Temperatibacter marinus TaxID=1456591 RepID=A0AA52EHJ2_9PROT|nr:efflux RND transporter periplasmic adaptor subunit [Temperatibacter marinus]WND03763.1 efflux RND transporter periplasmic adaptor subunit [Temperatibacter marinus]
MHLKTKIEALKVPLISAGIMLGGFLYFSSQSETVEATGESTNVVQKGELVAAYRPTHPLHEYRIRATGRLQAQNTLSVVGEVTGKVTYVSPELRAGKRFKEGDLLFTINDAIYKSDLLQAEAALASAHVQLKQAAADFNRAKELRTRGNTSASFYDTAETQWLVAQASVKQAEAQKTRAKELLSRTRISAPFEAIVVNESLSLGSYVTPGQQLAELMDASQAEISISLQKKQMAQVAATYEHGGEQPLKVTAFPSDGSVGSKSIDGVINRIESRVDPLSRTATIIAEFKEVFSEQNTGLLFADDFMAIAINIYSEQPVWKVPAGVVRDNGYVWIIDEGLKMRKLSVEVVSVEKGQALIKAPRLLTGVKVMKTMLPNEIEGKRVRLYEDRS